MDGIFRCSAKPVVAPMLAQAVAAPGRRSAAGMRPHARAGFAVTWSKQQAPNMALPASLRASPRNESTMKIRKLCLALAAASALGAGSARAATEIQWWHAMTGDLNDRVNDIADKFNATQSDYKVVPEFTGRYAETMTAGIAAYRAGKAPHILQVFEVGTATMTAEKKA